MLRFQTVIACSFFCVAFCVALSIAQDLTPSTTSEEGATSAEETPATETAPAILDSAAQDSLAAVEAEQARQQAVADSIAAEQIKLQAIADSLAAAEAEQARRQAVADSTAAAEAEKALQDNIAVAEAAKFKLNIGVRIAAGASALRGHKALPVDKNHALKLQPAFSVGAGLAFQVGINDLISIAPELQYTWYRSNEEMKKETNGDFDDLHEAGVSLHSLELPILARFNFACAYAEVGPQIGVNLYSKIYENSDLKKPDMNLLGFGPTLGGGINLNGILLGVRGHFGVLEYGKNTGGYPWVAQLSATKFFF